MSIEWRNEGKRKKRQAIYHQTTAEHIEMTSCSLYVQALGVGEGWRRDCRRAHDDATASPPVRWERRKEHLVWVRERRLARPAEESEGSLEVVTAEMEADKKERRASPKRSCSRPWPVEVDRIWVRADNGPTSNRRPDPYCEAPRRPDDC